MMSLSTLHTLQPTQFNCKCHTQQPAFASSEYAIDDTVLVKSGTTLEPVIICEFLQEEQKILVRKLVRRQRDLGCQEAKANELAWTSHYITLSPASIERRCHIRFFHTFKN